MYNIETTNVDKSDIKNMFFYYVTSKSPRYGYNRRLTIYGLGKTGHPNRIGNVDFKTGSYEGEVEAAERVIKQWNNGKLPKQYRGVHSMWSNYDIK